MGIIINIIVCVTFNLLLWLVGYCDDGGSIIIVLLELLY